MLGGKGAVDNPGRTAIRCAACGHANLAIDSWCDRCGEYLDREVISLPLALEASSEPDGPRGPLAGIDVVYSADRPGRRSRIGRVSRMIAPLGLLLVLLLLVFPASPLAALRAAVFARIDTVQLHLTPVRPVTLAPTPASPGANAAPSPQPVPSPSAPSPDQSSAGSTEQQAPVIPAPAPTPFTEPTPEDTPVAAVTLFYQRVVAHDFAGAAALWTPRMQSQYPPDQYIDQRFAATTSIDVRQAEQIVANAAEAVVAVDLVEVDAGQRYHWVGSWRVVATDSGWLLDQARFSCCQDAD